MYKPVKRKQLAGHVAVWYFISVLHADDITVRRSPSILQRYAPKMIFKFVFPSTLTFWPQYCFSSYPFYDKGHHAIKYELSVTLHFREKGWLPTDCATHIVASYGGPHKTCYLYGYCINSHVTSNVLITMYSCSVAHCCFEIFISWWTHHNLVLMLRCRHSQPELVESCGFILVTFVQQVRWYLYNAI